MTDFRVGHIYRRDGRPVTLADYLADGEVHRTFLMMKDTAPAGFACKECQGRGRWLDDLNITCPFCRGSGVVNSNGDETNNTEAARGGEFGTDHALINDAEMRDRLAKDAAWREASIGHRAGWAIDSSPEGKARRQKTFDAMAIADEERENAWRTLSSNVVTPTVAADTNTGDVRPTQADGRTTAQIAKDHQERMTQEIRDYENSVANAYKTLR